MDGAIAEAVAQGSLFPTVSDAAKGAFDQISTRKRGPVKARSANQHVYLQLLKRCELTFAEGPAGTGKTWLAVGHAVSLLEQGAVSRMILSRPAVEAGENLGFLPGDMREKVDPYLRPVYDALFDFMDSRHVERGLQTGMIEIAPLAFMRGRTLTNAVVLLDEAQNATSVQMKMFLTRLGEGSRMVVTGDPTQIDLPGGQKSGLIEAIDLLKHVEGIGQSLFSMVTWCAMISCAGSFRHMKKRENLRAAGRRWGRVDGPGCQGRTSIFAWRADRGSASRAPATVVRAAEAVGAHREAGQAIRQGDEFASRFWTTLGSRR